MSWLKDVVEQTFNALISEFGPVFLLLLLGIIFLFKKYDDAHKGIVVQKDAEIERLVKERNWYQNLILKDRISTDVKEEKKTPNREGGNKV